MRNRNKNSFQIDWGKANKALNACYLFCLQSSISSGNKKTWTHEGYNTIPLGFKRPSPWAIDLISAWSLSTFADNVLMLPVQLSCWVASVASMAKLNAWITQNSVKTRAFIQESIVRAKRFRPQWRRSASTQYNLQFCTWKFDLFYVSLFSLKRIPTVPGVGGGGGYFLLNNRTKLNELSLFDWVRLVRNRIHTKFGVRFGSIAEHKRTQSKLNKMFLF